MLCLRGNPAAQRYVTRLAHQHGKAKALTILAHKVGRAVYYMLRRGHAFDPNRFFHDPSPGEASRGAEVEATPGPAPRPSAPPRQAQRRPRHFAPTPTAEVEMAATLAD